MTSRNTFAIVGLSSFLVLSSASAIAAVCPQFSGEYQSTNTEPPSVLTIRQTGCERIELRYRFDGGDELGRALILDGRKRQEMETPDMVIESSYRWQGAEVLMSQETRWKSDPQKLKAQGRLFTNAAGDWLEVTRFVDENGADLGETTQTYKKKRR